MFGPQADVGHHLAGALGALGAAESGVDQQRLFERMADLLARIERAIGILEDDLHLGAQASSSVSGEAPTISWPSICKRARGRLLDHGDEAGEGRFSAARFADDGQRLAAARA